MAARYWSGNRSGTSTNWNYTTGGTNWGSASGVADNVSVPTSTDDVTFDGAGALGNSNSTISGTITVKSLTITAGYTATMTHNAVLTVAGNVTLNTSYTIAGSSAIAISATSTITSNGKTWPNNITFSGSATTKTLVGDFTISGTLSLAFNQANVINKTTTEKIYCNGITVPSGATPTGTIEIVLTGGSWTGVSSGSNVSVDLTLQGNISFVTGIAFGGTNKTLKYVSGTITQNNLSLVLGNAATVSMDTSGMIWYGISIASLTVTLLSTLYATTVTNSTTTTFSGSFGFEFSSYTHSMVSNATITLQESVTYTITTALTANTSRVGSILLFTSSHASNKAILTLNYGATCALLANLTRIDASGGRPIRSFNGTITDCLNCESFHDLLTVAS